MSEVKSIREILQNRIENQHQTEGLSQLIGNYPDGMFADEARTLGLKFFRPEPEPKECKFCGKELKYKGYYACEGIGMWLPTRCDCQEAIKYNTEQDKLKRLAVEKEEAEEAAAEMKRKIRKLQVQSQINELFRDRSFDNFNPYNDSLKSALSASKKYAENFKDRKREGRGLYYVGGNGTGKNHLSAAIAHQLINNNQSVIMNTMVRLLERVKRTYSIDNENEGKIFDLYSTVDLLIISDLGKEKPSFWTLQTLFTIIDERYEKMKPVIITTNYDHDSLMERLTVERSDDVARAIVSRLHEMCRGIVIEAEDYRRR
ncbi:MAG: ATP-binding protein [Candidatus Magnetobacterium sp. LHC-1]